MSYQPKLLDELFTSQQQAAPKTGPLIAEISDENGTDTRPEVEPEDKYTPSSSSASTTSKDEGPSMMELMMQAQQEAQAEKTKAKFEEEKKATKTFAGGFKKGFFGSGNTDKTKTKASAQSKQSSSSKTSTTSPDIPTIEKKNTSGSDRGNKNANLMMEEVQEAMKEESNPMLAQLKQGEWVTPDLEDQLKSNSIFQKGLQNPKCVQAMQLMQKDPKEAERRYKGDPDVDEFIREFGKIMSGHFNKLGAQQEEEQQRKQGGIPNPKPVQEIGPLHAEALERGKQQEKQKSTSQQFTDASDERVREIVNDPELSSMLMDPKLQQILQECGDPVKFQMHMRNPETRKKIEKLYKSGLVGTAR